jgi:hypothetical protein
MRHFRTIGHPNMSDQNAHAWAALLFGAIDLRDDPLPEEPLPWEPGGDLDGDEDFCLIHGFEHMRRRFGHPIAYCAECEREPDEDDDPPCEVCGGTGTLTRTVGLGPESKPCWECQKEWW